MQMSPGSKELASTYFDMIDAVACMHASENDVISVSYRLIVVPWGPIPERQRTWSNLERRTVSAFNSYTRNVQMY